jgi:hypothetical protein
MGLRTVVKKETDYIELYDVNSGLLLGTIKVGEGNKTRAVELLLEMSESVKIIRKRVDSRQHGEYDLNSNFNK